jgi:hypothetical protein
MKPKQHVKIDLAAYILLTVTSFWAFTLGTHFAMMHPLAQAIVVVIFTVAWWGLTHGMLFLQHRVRIVRRSPSAPKVMPAESRSA